MNYKESIGYLESLTSFGIKPGLERIEALLSYLGHPERAYKTVHVTGTNGKGSVTAFIQEALIVSGLKVGRYTSPHLESYTERIRFNGQDITEEDFANAVSRVAEGVAEIVAAGLESPTQFEVLTAAAFFYFSEQGVDYAVVEVGLGGLLDSTNVITPEVSVITNVTIDHRAYCGDTVEEIAVHKAGIIKPGIPVVTAAQGAALKIIQKKAHTEKAKLYMYNRDFVVSSRRSSTKGQMLTVEWRDGEKAMLFTSLAGVHQAVNLACAAMAIHILIKRDKRITGDAMREGFARTIWPGRFEICEMSDRIFIFDGAHNAGGAEAFGLTYLELYEDRPKTIVFSVLQDKDVSSIITSIVGARDTVVTVPAPTPRASDPLELAHKMPCTAYSETSVTAGMKRAMELSEPGDIIAVCGSLYILGEARRWLVKHSNTIS